MYGRACPTTPAYGLHFHQPFKACTVEAALAGIVHPLPLPRCRSWAWGRRNWWRPPSRWRPSKSRYPEAWPDVRCMHANGPLQALMLLPVSTPNQLPSARHGCPSLLLRRRRCCRRPRPLPEATAPHERPVGTAQARTGSAQGKPGQQGMLQLARGRPGSLLRAARPLNAGFTMQRRQCVVVNWQHRAGSEGAKGVRIKCSDR